MPEIRQDIPRLFTAVAEWGFCMIFVSILERRFSVGKTALLCLAALAFQAWFLVATDGLSGFLWVAAMMAAVGCMCLFLWACCKLTFMQAEYCLATAFLGAEFIASLEWQVHAWFQDQGMGRAARIALALAIYGCLFALMRYLAKRIFPTQCLGLITRKDLCSALALAVLAFAFSNLSFLVTSSPFIGTVQSDIFFIRTLVDFAGLALMYALQTRMSEYAAERELAQIRAVLESQYEQYRNYMDSMEIIHMKYHDLKHQIAGLRAETDGERRKEWLDAMEREVDEAHPAEQTGNPVLDAILEAKLLQARRHKIQLTCVADGTLLGFLHVTDICTIFGNALDNAIESVILLPEEDKRLIHLTVSSRKGFVLIQVANYCEQEIFWEEGEMPRTTKGDPGTHGYGLKSIRYSAEKYGGTVTVGLRDRWFELRVLLPKEGGEG